MATIIATNTVNVCLAVKHILLFLVFPFSYFLVVYIYTYKVYKAFGSYSLAELLFLSDTGKSNEKIAVEGNSKGKFAFEFITCFRDIA